MRLDRPADAYNVSVLASLTSRFPPFLLPLILINLTGHMALSGGRVSGSLYVLKTGNPEYLVGVFMALMAQLAGAHALSWAVGAYLPLSTTAPIFVGGMVRWLVNRRRTLMSGGKAAAAESDIGPGMLYATGLVAGGSLAGMLIAFLQGFAEPVANKLDLGHEYWTKLGLGGDVIAAGAFFVLSVVLIRQALSDRK